MANNKYYTLGENGEHELTGLGYKELGDLFRSWSFICSVCDKGKPLSRDIWIPMDECVINKIKKELSAKLSQKMQAKVITNLAESFIGIENAILKLLEHKRLIALDVYMVVSRIKHLSSKKQKAILELRIGERPAEERKAYAAQVAAYYQEHGIPNPIGRRRRRDSSSRIIADAIRLVNSIRHLPQEEQRIRIERRRDGLADTARVVYDNQVAACYQQIENIRQDIRSQLQLLRGLPSIVKQTNYLRNMISQQSVTDREAYRAEVNQLRTTTSEDSHLLMLWGTLDLYAAAATRRNGIPSRSRSR